MAIGSISEVFFKFLFRVLKSYFALITAAAAAAFAAVSTRSAFTVKLETLFKLLRFTRRKLHVRIIYAVLLIGLNRTAGRENAGCAQARYQQQKNAGFLYHVRVLY